MDIAALITISLGALLGLIMLRYFFKNIHIPKGLSIIHGFLMVLGVIFLLIYNLTTNNHHKHWQSFSVFIVAIIVGSWATWWDISKHPHYRKIIFTHIIIGASGIAILYYHVLSGH
jgi:hypothetical protein